MKRIISIFLVLLCALFLENNSIASQKEQVITKEIPSLTNLAAVASARILLIERTDIPTIEEGEKFFSFKEQEQLFNAIPEAVHETIEKEALNLLLPLHLSCYYSKDYCYYRSADKNPPILIYSIQKRITSMKPYNWLIMSPFRPINGTMWRHNNLCTKTNVLDFNNEDVPLQPAPPVIEAVKHLEKIITSMKPYKPSLGNIIKLTIHCEWDLNNPELSQIILNPTTNPQLQTVETISITLPNNQPQTAITITDLPKLESFSLTITQTYLPSTFSIDLTNCSALKKLNLYKETYYINTINLTGIPNAQDLITPHLKQNNLYKNCTIIWDSNNNNETVEKILDRKKSLTLNKQTVDSETSNATLTKNNVPSISFWTKLFTLINFTQTNPASSWTPTFITTWTSWLWNWKWFN